MYCTLQCGVPVYVVTNCQYHSSYGPIPTSIDLHSIVKKKKRCRDGWGFVYLSSLLYTLFSFPVCVLVFTPPLHLFPSLLVVIRGYFVSNCFRKGGAPFKQDMITSWINTLFADQISNLSVRVCVCGSSVCESSVCNQTSITKTQRRLQASKSANRETGTRFLYIWLVSPIPAAGDGGVFWRLLSAARPTPLEWEQKWRYMFSITCIQGMWLARLHAWRGY